MADDLIGVGADSQGDDDSDIDILEYDVAIHSLQTTASGTPRGLAIDGSKFRLGRSMMESTHASAVRLSRRSITESVMDAAKNQRLASEDSSLHVSGSSVFRQRSNPSVIQTSAMYSDESHGVYARHLPDHESPLRLRTPPRKASPLIQSSTR